MAKQSKRYRALRDKVKANGPVPLPEAVRLLKTFNTTKFNQTVEVSTHLGIDPKQTDQNVRGSVALPHGIGKSVRVAVFAQGENAEKARAAGADIVGADDLAQQIKGGTMDFDVALATPDMMGVVGPLGRVLGPRGLMPSPRSGHRHDRHHLRRPRVQGRQDRVPQRQGGQRRRRRRQAGLLGGAIGRQHQRLLELPAVAQAGGRQGDLHPLDHRLGHHEPGHPGLGLSRRPRPGRSPTAASANQPNDGGRESKP